MKRLFLLLLCFLGITPSQSMAGEVTVATWNLQNFLLMDRFEDGRFRPHYPMPEARKKRIRQLIIEVQPDILFLQEIGSPAFLRELQMDLAASGLSYPHSSFASLPDSRRGLSFLAKIPPVARFFHDPADSASSGSSLRRGIQEVVFSIDDKRFRFFHVHLKSRYSKDPSDPGAVARRAAEIQILSTFLDQQKRAFPNDALIAVGDFNTPVTSPLLVPLRAGWAPLDVRDSSRFNWTYEHRKSGRRERLDGFWFPIDRPVPMLPVAIFPSSASPSDHRLLLSALLF